MNIKILINIKMNNNLTDFFCINYDLELIFEELVEYKIKANKETIQEQYFLYNLDLVETILYFVKLKSNTILNE